MTAAPPPAGRIDPRQDLSWARRAWPLVRAHRRPFVVALSLSFASLVIMAVIPGLIQRAVDHGLIEGDRDLAPYAAWIVGLCLVRLVMSYWHRRLLFRVAYDLEYDLRNLVYEHLARLPAAFYDKTGTGELMSRANSDVRALQLYLAFAPAIFIQCSLAVIAFAQMLAISVPLAVVAMSVMPAVGWAGARMRDEIHPVSWLIQSRLADVATIVDENVTGVRVVKSFSAEGRQQSALARAAARVRWAMVADTDVRARWSPILENTPRLGSALVLAFGGWMAIDGRTSLGAIIAFNAYVAMLQPPFRMLGMLLSMGQRAAASARRVYEILDTEPEITDHPGAVDLAAVRGEVELRDVTFGYGDDAPVLEHLDLHVKPGEIVAIVGGSGSGKSTIARLLQRMYDVDGGAVLIDGHDVRGVTQASLRPHVGVVADEAFLFSVPVAENIAYGRPGATRAEIVEAARAAGAHDFISRLPDGYDTVVGERGFTLSGGERQRVAIARALLVNPPILVLDDATSAVDVHVEARIFAGLRRLLAQRTTILIAHRHSTVRLADRVVLLEGGRVLAEGTHEELLANEPAYATSLSRESS